MALTAPGEKLFDWMEHAVRTWSTAAFYGKTEDDAYIHLDGPPSSCRGCTRSGCPTCCTGR